MSRILIADDDREVREVVKLLMEAEGFEVVPAENGEEAVRLAGSEIDLYILDVNMPVLDGFAAGRKIRENYYAPILFLTAYSSESDKMMGFAVGADDYIEKPFSNSELIMRVKAFLRRMTMYQPKIAEQAQKNSAEKSSLIRVHDLEIDIDSQTVRKNGEAIILTYTEFKILELLATHPGKIFSLENIYRSVWGEDAVGDETIMVHIKNIRKKIGDTTRNSRYLKTAWGKGYYVD